MREIKAQNELLKSIDVKLLKLSDYAHSIDRWLDNIHLQTAGVRNDLIADRIAAEVAKKPVRKRVAAKKPAKRAVKKK